MGTRFIPTRVHGVLDYVHGAALLAAPELLRTKDEPRATLVSRLAGGGATATTLMTDFELGAVKVIPMPMHLALDAASGAILASAPWLLGYAKGGPRYWLPHAFVGVAEVLAAAVTKTEPSYYKAKPELADVFRGLLKAKQGSGWQRISSNRGTYGGAVGLMAGGLGAGALILFLLQRTRGDTREEAEGAPEAAGNGVEEHIGALSTEARSQEVVEHSVGQEKGAVEDQEQGIFEEPAEEHKRTVQEFARRLEEHSVVGQNEEEEEEEDTSEETEAEPGGAARGSLDRSKESPRDREGGRVEKTAGEEARRTGERDSAAEEMTVVGVLAKMGEAFEETGGGRFVLASEDEGNFDLRGKEDELDEIYQQQTRARVVGRIVDEDSQPRRMEVDEVEPA